MPRRLSEVPTKTRFATYCLLSLISVALFQIKPSDDTTIAVRLLWITIPSIATVVFHGIDNFVNGRPPTCTEACISPSYAAPMSTALVLLGYFATWIQRYLAVTPASTDHGTDAQACAIHFALSFYILSECEYHRLYWKTRRQERPSSLISLLDAFHEANNDYGFEESRDCISYRDLFEQLETAPRDRLMPKRFFKWWLVTSLYTIPFHMVAMACLNFPMKRLANPDPKGDSFPLHNEFLEIFFTPKHQIFLCLDSQLQRPIRLFNRMLFWTIVEWMERGWNRWGKPYMRGES